jgi:hypothetical protein
MAGDPKRRGTQLNGGPCDSGWAITAAAARSQIQRRAPAEVINEQSAGGAAPGPAAATVAVARRMPRAVISPGCHAAGTQAADEDATGAGVESIWFVPLTQALRVNGQRARSASTPDLVQPVVEIATLRHRCGTAVGEGRRGTEPDEPGSSNHDEGQAATAREDTDGSAPDACAESMYTTLRSLHPFTALELVDMAAVFVLAIACAAHDPAPQTPVRYRSCTAQ